MVGIRRMIVVAILGATLGGSLVGLGWQYLRAKPKVELTTEYQAVLLTNGQAFFGKIQDAGSPYPVLTQVHYVQRQVNPETKQVTSTLRKTREDWHQPDRVILNAHHILFIEPVKPDSVLAKLIEELKRP